MQNRGNDEPEKNLIGNFRETKIDHNCELRITHCELDKVHRQWSSTLEAYPHTSAILAEQTEFRNMYIVEVARGCGRHCRFCMAGYCFRKPRPRPLANIIRDIEHRPEGTEKIGLMGAAVSDYPQIEELTDYLVQHKIKFSVASLRADTLTENQNLYTHLQTKHHL